MTPIGASRRHHAQPVVAGAGVHEWLQGAQAWWQRAARLAAIWSVRQGGAPAIAQAQARRFARLVAHARLDSPFYRDAYRDLPPGPVALAQLPVVTRRALMQRFDDWVTDPAVTRAAVDAFGADRNRIGDRFLGRYLVWKSSGTSGEPGIYVQDADAVATYDALVLAQMQTAAVAAGVAAGAWLHGGRAALIAATGDHYASIASWQRQARDHPWSATCALSVLRPVAEWVAALGRFQPAYLASRPRGGSTSRPT